MANNKAEPVRSRASALPKKPVKGRVAKTKDADLLEVLRADLGRSPKLLLALEKAVEKSLRKRKRRKAVAG